MKKIIIISLILSISLLLSISIRAEDDIEKEIMVWEDNCQSRCIGNTCTVVVGKTFYVNDSDNTCKPIEEARSLKNTPIKCVVESDGKHLVECLDYNLTAVKLNLQTIDKKEKSIPLTVIKPTLNVSVDEKTKEDIVHNIIYEEVTKTNHIFNDAISNTKEYDVWVPLGIGEYIKFGENSTTIQLNDSTTVLADIKGAETNDYNVSPQVMINISSIPAGVVIDDFTWCMGIAQVFGTSDNDITVWRVNNHTWTEATLVSNADGWNSQKNQYTNQTNTTLNSTAVSTYACFNATIHLRQEYQGGYPNLTLRFEDRDFHLETATGTYDTSAAYGLNFGQYDWRELRFEDSENTKGSGLKAYGLVTYTETPTDTCTYSSGAWNIDCSDMCNITSDVAIDTSDLNITGTGTGYVYINAVISGFTNGRIENCPVTCETTNCFQLG